MPLSFDQAVAFDSDLYTFDGLDAGSTGSPSGKAGRTSPTSITPGVTSPDGS